MTVFAGWPKEFDVREQHPISHRISEALRQFPPFSMFATQEVAQLAGGARVTVLVKGDSLWQQGDSPGSEVYFLARGRVEYHRTHDGATELVGVRDVGDILGLSAFHAGEASFPVTAEVLEDSILYAFAWTDIKALLEDNDRARYYVRRHLFWGTRVGETVREAGADAHESDGEFILESHLAGARLIEARPSEQLLSCEPSRSIREAAELMVRRGVPSIVVIDSAGLPLGFMTRRDLVTHVVVGNYDAHKPVTDIMTSAIMTVAPLTSAMATLVTMLDEQIEQICITEDGTADSKVLDVCTARDLLAPSENHPMSILNSIHRATSPARFRELCDDIEAVARSYLEAGISGIVIGQICAQLYNNLVRRFLELSEAALAAEGIPLPDVAWAWMAVGSDGRREQVLRTDMDNAFVFESTANPLADEQHRAIFLQLAERVVELMVQAGFTRCQGGIMASNPRWCRSEKEWLAELNDHDQMQQGDGMIRAFVLYDLRFVAGDTALCERMRDGVFNVDQTASQGPLRQLAEQVVEMPPPLNFWGKFIVEKKGGHQGEFDIKSRSLAPLRDAARVFALYYGLRKHHSTGGRWLELANTRPELAELAQLAHDSYDLLLRQRNLIGIRRADDGRYIDPSSLNKLEREQLTNVFDVQRMVQDAVRRLFNLDLLRR